MDSAIGNFRHIQCFKRPKSQLLRLIIDGYGPAEFKYAMRVSADDLGRRQSAR